jgi:hypothetical protein
MDLEHCLLDGINFLKMTTPMSLSSCVAPSFGLDLDPDLKLTPGPDRELDPKKTSCCIVLMASSSS